ncbi:MAG: hypothetical protein OER77_17375, partial [Myxococcales bacterium]|nr:hypothetical protein [Myxococcales bacterium]
MGRLFIWLAVTLVLPSCARASKTTSEHPTPIMTPPVAPIHPDSVTLHDDTRVDNYHWLREKGTYEVIRYLEAENAYTATFMEPTEALQKALYEEIVGRIQETDQS